MTREIKFRIWDVDAQIMQWPTHIPNMVGGSYDYDPICSTYEDGVKTFYETCPPNPEVINGKRRVEIEDYILMQYTGLKDKNGKEIYEGDIVKIHETAYWETELQKAMAGGIDVDIGEYIGVITWDDEGADYSCVQKGQTIEDAVGWPRHEQVYEVIGNKFENPELLTKQL